MVGGKKAIGHLLTLPTGQHQHLLNSMDSEREKFRTYIEKSGVMSALTDALVRLYEETEKPSDALNYLKTTLGTRTVDDDRMRMFEGKGDLYSLKNSVKEQQHSIESQKATIEAQQSEIACLKERLAKFEAKDKASKLPQEDATQA
ncbi:c-Myc-binding protein homolog [Procambarus clarkii]|uniref:c-Myc-binding protein homolog n=1 Tax=Procambarus clarkii TaxID=6728 RepID=UPI003744ADBE